MFVPNNTINILNELANMRSDISRIENNAIHIYSHLMKCAYYSNRINHSWINTIFKCNKDINKVPRSRLNTASRDQKSFNKIRKNAINEYHDEGNPDGEIQYQIVLNHFPTIIDICNIDKLKDYLLERANNIGDSSAIDYINKGYENMK